MTIGNSTTLYKLILNEEMIIYAKLKEVMGLALDRRKTL
jgi:hypothetical protein